MALINTDSAWADVAKAWEAGFSIVATALNEVLALHSTGLSIRAAPPPLGQTLNHCRRLLLDALRRTLTPLSPESEIAPWSVGFINGTNNAEELIGDERLDPDQHLK